MAEEMRLALGHEEEEKQLWMRASQKKRMFSHLHSTAVAIKKEAKVWGGGFLQPLLLNRIPFILFQKAALTRSGPQAACEGSRKHNPRILSPVHIY